jgi:hypothetical protein
MRNLTLGNSKSITAMRASKFYRLDGDGARRGWESMSAWMPQAKVGALGGCHRVIRQAKLDGDHCGKLPAKYRMQRLGW